MPADIDIILDPARLAALWSARSASAAKATATDSLCGPGSVAAADAAAEMAAASETAAAAASETAAVIDPHAQLQAMERAIEQALAPHLAPDSPPRRALDIYLQLLRAQLAAAFPADAAPAPEAAGAALPLLDQLEDLLEAMLRAGPWSAPAHGGQKP